MNPYPHKHQLGRVTLSRSTHQVSWNPDLTGEQLAPDRAAFQLIAVPEVKVIGPAFARDVTWWARAYPLPAASFTALGSCLSSELPP